MLVESKLQYVVSDTLLIDVAGMSALLPVGPVSVTTSATNSDLGELIQIVTFK